MSLAKLLMWDSFLYPVYFLYQGLDLGVSLGFKLDKVLIVDVMIIDCCLYRVGVGVLSNGEL